MALTTLARVKALHGSIQGTSIDAALGVIIAAVDAMIGKYLGCDFAYGSKTEKFSVQPGQRRFILTGLPIESVTVVDTAITGDYDAASVIPSNQYYADLKRGILTLRTEAEVNEGEPDGLRVQYVAGLDTDWQTDADFAEYLPLDYAASIQTLAELTRRPDWGASSKSVGGGQRTHVMEDDPRGSPLLPKVMNILDKFRR